MFGGKNASNLWTDEVSFFNLENISLKENTPIILNWKDPMPSSLIGPSATHLFSTLDQTSVFYVTGIDPFDNTFQKLYKFTEKDSWISLNTNLPAFSFRGLLAIPPFQ